MQTAIQIEEEELSGWGMNMRARCRVARPASAEEIAALLAEARASGATVALRGAGCSYGDAALNAGNIVLDCSRLDRILDWDAATGVAVVEPGVTLDRLWHKTLADGWWPPVVPGTSAVTMGGAAAANVHGKNNWQIGSFGEHVTSFDLLLPSGETVTCSPDEHSDLYFGALGGMGLLGCITRLSIQMKRVHSGDVWEITSVHRTLADLLAGLEEASAWADDLVTWIDTSARGQHIGRGLLKASRDLTETEEPNPKRSYAQAVRWPKAGLASRVSPAMFARFSGFATSPTGIQSANRWQWWRGQSHSQRRPHLTSYPAANFPLDVIPNFRYVYQPGGLVQHQSFIPTDAAHDTFVRILETARAAGLVPAFGVLKKHRASPFTLNYLLDGYSLALDFPVRRGKAEPLQRLLHALNDLVAESGGRCYFAKDSAVTPEQVRRMFPAAQLTTFAALKHTYDPQGMLSSNLYRRALASAI